MGHLQASESYSVIVPARNAENEIARVIDAALSAKPAPAEVIVVDDASTDNTAEIAKASGARVVSHGGDKPIGPARARNLGAQTATCDLYLFLDADVVIHPEAPNHLIRALRHDPKIAAAFGSYGAWQACPNIAARYANLRHHFFHQSGRREAKSFWTGLGMVRASAFAHLRGFSDKIEKPAMEDVEIGLRFSRAGYRVRLVPQAQGTHLKNWTLRQLWRDDIVSRALPWSTLIVHGRAPEVLNARSGEKLKAVLVYASALLLALSLFVPGALPFAVLFASVYVAMNLPFFWLLLKRGGVRTFVPGIFLHAAYHAYSSTAFALVWLNSALPLPPLLARQHVALMETDYPADQ
ncbi:glycosyltransferase family 2 protein [Parvularcula lutaonensis]|uniref:Glycosyltransferase family 2 protein n=1 Tax=Parvularcula lutaonensis TaxID=491923 RepID=A0ABV7MC35_9PROT|nr:glycosyltransferase [Parvularcula lutaonensis]GGY38024.1 hypothetical protein GCM10007148_02860 [Parvularcula lutaonensis]